MRQAIAAQMKRGHVDVFITVRRVGESNRQVQVDAALAVLVRLAAGRAAQQPAVRKHGRSVAQRGAGPKQDILVHIDLDAHGICVHITIRRFVCQLNVARMFTKRVFFAIVDRTNELHTGLCARADYSVLFRYMEVITV